MMLVLFLLIKHEQSETENCASGAEGNLGLNFMLKT